jgi:hypothetical protein
VPRSSGIRLSGTIATPSMDGSWPALVDLIVDDTPALQLARR